MTPDEIAKVLQRRGFFIEYNDGHLVLSDNSHGDDIEYLSELLFENDIGYVQDNEIYIQNFQNGSKLNAMFDIVDAIDNEVCWNTSSDWGRFRRERYGTKVPVRLLEPNIAYYCKAISACGLKTASSCDGNHVAGNSKMLILFETPDYNFWHQLLWKHILNLKYKINWNEGYDTIYIHSNNRQKIYDELSNAAEYLYQNRVVFRDIKNRSSAFLTKSYCQSHSQEQIRIQLESNLEKILDENIL